MLATLVLLGIVLPVAMRGVSLALAASSNARHTAEATALAEGKLNEMIVDGTWSTSTVGGDFGTDWPGYRWTCTGASRDYSLTELTLQVVWTERGQERSLVLSTLVGDTSAGTGTSSGGTGGTP